MKTNSTLLGTIQDVSGTTVRIVLSNDSPIGKGIIGLQKGAQVVVKSETGQEVTVKVIEVK